jgi:hypothetical protein
MAMRRFGKADIAGQHRAGAPYWVGKAGGSGERSVKPRLAGEKFDSSPAHQYALLVQWLRTRA